MLSESEASRLSIFSRVDEILRPYPQDDDGPMCNYVIDGAFLEVG
jgi:hypothetical protein